MMTAWFMGLGAQQQALGLTLVGCAGYLLCILLVWPLWELGKMGRDWLREKWYWY